MKTETSGSLTVRYINGGDAVYISNSFSALLCSAGSKIMRRSHPTLDLAIISQLCVVVIQRKITHAKIKTKCVCRSSRCEIYKIANDYEKLNGFRSPSCKCCLINVITVCDIIKEHQSMSKTFT